MLLHGTLLILSRVLRVADARRGHGSVRHPPDLVPHASRRRSATRMLHGTLLILSHMNSVAEKRRGHGPVRILPRVFPMADVARHPPDLIPRASCRRCTARMLHRILLIVSSGHLIAETLRGWCMAPSHLIPCVPDCCEVIRMLHYTYTLLILFRAPPVDLGVLATLPILADLYSQIKPSSLISVKARNGRGYLSILVCFCKAVATKSS